MSADEDLLGFGASVARYHDQVRRRQRRARVIAWVVVSVFLALAAAGAIALLSMSCRSVWATDERGKPVELRVCGGRAWAVE